MKLKKKLESYIFLLKSKKYHDIIQEIKKKHWKKNANKKLSCTRIWFEPQIVDVIDWCTRLYATKLSSIVLDVLD